MRIALIGRPGCGKGTVSKGLHSRSGAIELSSGELMRQEIAGNTTLGEKIKSAIEAGKLAPDEHAIELVRKNLVTPDVESCGFILDGFPRNLFQAHELERILRELDMPIEAVLDIAVSRDVARERLLSRMRPGETKETIEARLADFEVTTYPVIAHYESLGLLRRVDGEGSPEEVIQLALKAVGL